MPGRARGIVEVPSGLLYRPGFIEPDEETRLLAHIDDLQFEHFVFRGQAARRMVRHFGYGYDFDSREVQPTEPIPDWLLDLRERGAALTPVPGDAFVEALVTQYPPGATIGWHRDAPAFGGFVVGISLLAPCRMRFQRGAGEARRVYDLDLEPRSAYVISGSARAGWQHSIPPVEELRYSITFRTLRRAR